MTGLEFRGLDGANPLAFLAGLGTLCTLTRAWPDRMVRIGWQRSAGAWRPLLATDTRATETEVVAALDRELRREGARRPFELGPDLNVTPDHFREVAGKVASADPPDRRSADFLAAFGCEAMVSNGTIQDTALRTMSGAGHQHFLDSMKELVARTTAEHLRAALFDSWRYDDERPSMRWDPSDDRRYALRWRDPSKDQIRTVRGANRLAVEALVLFPTAPVGSRLETTGFRGRGSRDTYWRWPIWTAPVSVDVVRSLVALSWIQPIGERPFDREMLTRMGIAEVYSSQRLTVGKYRNFSPAQPV
ncbi:MAG: type I-G CRISPR-associated protein, Cas3-extension family [bacterium]